MTSEPGWADLVKDVIDRHGRLDVLVNNAGIFRVLGLEATSLDDWNQMLAINFATDRVRISTNRPCVADSRNGSEGIAGAASGL